MELKEHCCHCKKITPSKAVEHADGTEFLCAACGKQQDYFPKYDDYYDDGVERNCRYCGGEGWGIVGVDWDSDDPINGPYDGETQQCPCCHGSGDAKDCTFW